jgi:transposase
MVYVGMDVHRKRSQIAIIDEDGRQLLTRKVANHPAELAPLLGSLDSRIPVALEAAYGWSWIVDALEQWDLEPHLAHPKNCKAIASAKLKNDKLVAFTLANLLRTDYLAEAWIAPRQTRDLRTLLRHRAALVGLSTSIKNRIHSVLAEQGLQVESKLWTKAGTAWLRGLELRPVQSAVIADSLQLLAAVEVPLRRLRREIRRIAVPDPQAQALIAIPGIGYVTALTLVAEIGDVSRFAPARKLCGWAGLTTTVRNSDRTVRHGHISKQGSSWVRVVLVECDQRAKERPPLVEFYRQTAARRGTNIATVAVARKLLVRCFHVLSEVSDRPIPDFGEGLEA